MNEVQKKTTLELNQIAREIYECSNRLKDAGDALFKLAKEKAESERKYRRQLQIEIIKLRNDKVQATLIPDIARGLTADLKFQRDLDEARYTSGRDNVDAITTQLSGLQTIFKRFDEV